MNQLIETKTSELIEKITKELNSDYIYYQPMVDIEGNDCYFCNCGNKIKADPNTASFVFTANLDTEMDLSDFAGAQKSASIVCDKCYKDFSKKENFSLIQNLDSNFYEKYCFEKTSEYIRLFRFKGLVTLNPSTHLPEVFTGYASLTINNSTKDIYFEDFDGYKEIKKNKIELNNLIQISEKFFYENPEATIVEGFIAIHDFIGHLAKLIMDAKNMNVIDELMSQMIGKSGVTTLNKIITIFLSILCYPNLSTIALTKGNLFLYDLLTNCPLPETKHLIEQNATSPIKIFNALIIYKNQELQQELDQDDKNKLGYVKVSDSGKVVNYKFDKTYIERVDSNVDIIHKSGGKLFIRDTIENRKISHYIFNSLRNFSDYYKLVKWLKFVSYDTLINFVMNYEIDFLNIAIDHIEFRDDINEERIKQFLPLMLSYGALIDKHQDDLDRKNYETFVERFRANGQQDYIENYEDIPKIQKPKYESIKNFDFMLYDDCSRMIYELNWDPNKLFNKIKDFAKLGEFHNNLLKHRGFISDQEANQRFIDFSSKFKYLEKYSADLDIFLDIKLIETPQELMNHAVELKNCAGSFVRRVAQGEYIAFMVDDLSYKRQKDEQNRFMLVIEITPLGLEFVGVKSYCNEYGSDRFKEDVKTYLTAQNILYKELPSIRPGVNSKEVSYNGVFEKVNSEK